MPSISTQLVPAALGLEEAARLLRAGELVAFPTETVYGLGADARSDEAVGKIYTAKGRPSTNPLIVHIPDVDGARACSAAFSPLAETLAKHFWPGPLTLVVPRAAHLSPRVSAGLTTVALRCPDHPVALELLRAAAVPVAAPSANRSGFTSPTSAQHVLVELNGRIRLILDAGVSRVGVESTVLDLTTSPPTVLRPGAVTQEMLEALIGPVLTPVAHVMHDQAAPSPGMLDSHYAPRTPAFRFSHDQWGDVLAALAGQPKVVLISHDPALTLPPAHDVLLLPADAPSYARVLYASLREADTRNASSIYVLMPDSQEGMWAAVTDRLRRATRPIVR